MALRTLGALLAAGLSLTACEPEPSVTLPPAGVSASAVLILGEGNFRRGNAAVSSYEASSSTVANPALTWPDGFVADVLQSGQVLDDELVLVVNNSNTVLRYDVEQLGYVDSIQALGSPRYLVKDRIGGDYLISELFAGALLRVDPQTRRRVRIPGPTHTEFLLDLPGGQVVVASPAEETLYLFSWADNALTPALIVPRGMGQMVFDELQNVVYAVTATDENGYLIRLDAGLSTCDTLHQFAMDDVGLYPRLALGEDNLYVLQASLHRFERLPTGQLGPAQRINLGARTLYGLDIDECSQEVYVADARRFSGNGMGLRLSPNGQTVLDSFATAPLPNGFVFRP